MADELPPPPRRRAGRECGYEHRAELLAANRALGAALTKLARDADPDARAAGAVIAATMADLVDQAARLAVESSGKARRSRPRAEEGRQVLTYLGIGLKPDAIPRDADESKSRNGEHRVSPQLTDSDRDSESGVSRLSRGETRSNPLQLLHRTSLSGHACRACSQPIDPAAGDVHPGCDTEVPR